MESRAATLSLVGGALALDFANTMSGRETGERAEHLQLPGHLVDWANHAGGTDAATAARSRADIAADAAAAEKLLRHSRELREAIYAAGSAIADRRAPADADLRTIKGLAARSVGQATLRPRPAGGYDLDFSKAPPDVALLGPIAWSALGLLQKGDFHRLKRCAECGWLFLDQSKNNSRRWCDMATCGNRTKLRRHRGRR
jgi:predicted RNA-binding Zn ribbon-like protein